MGWEYPLAEADQSLTGDSAQLFALISSDLGRLSVQGGFSTQFFHSRSTNDEGCIRIHYGLLITVVTTKDTIPLMHQ